MTLDNVTRESLIALVAEAEYEHDRRHNGECEDWPDWNHRNGLVGADYWNRAQAGVKAMWGTVPPWMEPSNLLRGDDYPPLYRLSGRER